MIAKTYCEASISDRTYPEWFQHFKSGNFDVKDKEHPWPVKKFEDTELEALLDYWRPMSNTTWTFKFIKCDSTSYFSSFEGLGNDLKARQLGVIQIEVERCQTSFVNIRKVAPTAKKKGVFTSYCKWRWKVDQKKIMRLPWPCINGKAKHPWLKAHVVYLMGSARRHLLWAIATGWNHHRKSLPNTINVFESSIKRKMTTIWAKTRQSDFAAWQCSTTCC